ncbi:MAG: LysR family transcriptional regulator [Betaproteobacteria bacterium]|nr:LysR family transcriptional regulator [Betaproteobacteria bacterium]PWB58142.1 MAG: LysR family transcriptional regulator [Betaproteobacteria bacterium]
MPLRHITLRQLKVFEAVARHLSFSRAAEELHLTQPAVSMQVKSLESQAGLPLFEQVGKKIHLTEAGAEVARFALEVHSGLKDCEDALAAIRGISGGRLHLAVVSTAKYFAPRLLSEFSRRHPGVTVKLSVVNREEVIGALQANQVDLAIMGRPPRGLDVEATEFAKHPHGIIASPEHPLARKRGLELSRLAGENFLLREPGSGTRMSMERVFAEHGVKLASSMELASNETIKQAVMAGMGLAFLSLHTVGLELATGRLVRLDVKGTPVTRDWHVVSRQGKRLSPLAEAFRAFLAAEGAKLIEETTGVHVREAAAGPRKSPKRASAPARNPL